MLCILHLIQSIKCRTKHFSLLVMEAAEDKAKWCLVSPHVAHQREHLNERMDKSVRRKKMEETEVELAFDKRPQKLACKTFILSHD